MASCKDARYVLANVKPPCSQRNQVRTLSNQVNIPPDGTYDRSLVYLSYQRNVCLFNRTTQSSRKYEQYYLLMLLLGNVVELQLSKNVGGVMPFRLCRQTFKRIVHLRFCAVLSCPGLDEKYARFPCHYDEVQSKEILTYYKHRWISLFEDPEGLDRKSDL